MVLTSTSAATFDLLLLRATKFAIVGVLVFPALHKHPRSNDSIEISITQLEQEGFFLLGLIIPLIREPSEISIN